VETPVCRRVGSFLPYEGYGFRRLGHRLSRGTEVALHLVGDRHDAAIRLARFHPRSRARYLFDGQAGYLPQGVGKQRQDALQDHRYGRLLPASVARRRAGHGYFRRIQQFGNAVVHAGGAGRRLPDARVLSGTLYRQQHPFLPDRVPSAYLAAHRLRRVGRCGQCLFVVRTFPLGSDAAQLRAGSALGVQTPRERAYRLRFRPQDQRFGFQY